MYVTVMKEYVKSKRGEGPGNDNGGRSEGKDDDDTGLKYDNKVECLLECYASVAGGAR